MLFRSIEHEENARLSLIEKKSKVLFNHIGRAHGTLTNAYVIPSKETMNLLSLERLAVDLGMLPPDARAIVEELFLITQPAHLQSAHPGREKLSSEERDTLRADLLRDRLQALPRPDIRAVGGA